SYRNDVTLPCDLVEEVARIMGYDLLPETLIEGGLPPQEVNRALELEEKLRDIMAACGMDEVITYSVNYSVTLEKLAQAEALSTGSPSPALSTDSYRSWDPARRLVTIVNPLSSRQ